MCLSANEIAALYLPNLFWSAVLEQFDFIRTDWRGYNCQRIRYDDSLIASIIWINGRTDFLHADKTPIKEVSVICEVKHAQEYLHFCLRDSKSAVLCLLMSITNSFPEFFVEKFLQKKLANPLGFRHEDAKDVQEWKKLRLTFWDRCY